MREPVDDIALYAHWPFCLSLCPYCDFNSHVRENIDQAVWRKAFLRELEHYAAQVPGRRLTSIFFGGGTPSLMPPETAGALIARARDLFVTDKDIEITLEANPTSAENSTLEGFAEAGIGRLSLGVQALNDAALSSLGRTHTAAEARATIAAAGEIFSRFSFDLIYGRPGQTPDAWARELDEAIGLARGHLSAYQLTIEAGTPYFLAQARGDLVLPDDEDGAAMFEHTQEALAGAGLPAYEVSNHAKPGQESHHNLTYWNYRDYLGVGPGAHGRITIDGETHATRQHRAPEVWLKQVLKAGHSTRTNTVLSRDTKITEMVMMGMRLAAGINSEEFRRRIGKYPTEVFAPDVVTRLVGAGYLNWTETGFHATPPGRQRLNAVINTLLKTRQ
ncbi:MAG: coproporphyrinogen III oxidase [Alphaproteobacteria bacterium]|nr:coproporphyrinogen III oxidase [Alphaproteobacteria bacterium]